MFQIKHFTFLLKSVLISLKYSGILNKVSGKRFIGLLPKSVCFVVTILCIIICFRTVKYLLILFLMN